MEPKAKLVATATKRSHKRKIPLPVLVLDRVVDHENFEDILPSDENREDASSDSFHWSNDEEDEFKVTRPTSFEASRKHGRRLRMSSRGRKRGPGNGIDPSVATRDPRELSDRGFDTSETRGAPQLQEYRGKAEDLRVLFDRTKGGYTDDTLQVGSTSAQHADERHEHEKPQQRIAKTSSLDSPKRRPKGGDRKHRRRQ